MLHELIEALDIKEICPPQKEARKVVENGDAVLMSVPTAASKYLDAYATVMRAVKSKKKVN